ncbi:hypothetical protein, conserved [Plasmodium gonderi]|uniref:Sexual stage-specific protein G37 n=1 Tax=Plasmodium gonderi TaxID=77519 RepID=A0A1Y1JMF1_PLAGO|nr:hypothetical protein, conserved [Plasmodium gonderi]GAW82778.1 hypothetical protein, conserved [Plasmodium gonderi]
MKALGIFLILCFFLCQERPVAVGVILKQDPYLDDEFRSFTYFFDIWSKTVDKAYSINQVSSGIMKVYMSLLLFLLLPYFAYIGIFGHTRNQTTLTLSSIMAYFTALIVFFLTNGILNIGFVCSLPLVFGSFVFNLANSDYTIKAMFKYTRYIFCFILAKFIYDILTNLRGDEANAFDYGLSGYIYMSMLKGNYYMILKIVHLFVLSLMALIIKKLFTRVFDEGDLKSPQSILSDKYMVSFLCSLPIAASITQIYYLASQTINPIDPSVFFMIPTSINFSSTSTIFSLSYYNHVLNKIPSNISEFL